jgi:hypothetical protein
LKPMTMASDAEASRISDSVIVPDALVQDANLDLAGGQVFGGFGEGLEGTLHVGPDDDPQFLDIAFAHLLKQLIQRNLAAGRPSSDSRTRMDRTWLTFLAILSSVTTMNSSPA